MQWFYANKSDQQVAFEEGNLKTLVKDGSIKKDTLVWNEALPDWKPCGDIRPELFETVSSSPATDLSNPTEPELPPPISSPTQNADAIDGVAVTSLVFGVLAIFGFPLAGFVAVICGHLSRKKLVERTGTTEGGGLSLAGLILGYIGIALGLAFTFLVVILAVIGANSPT